MLVFGYWDSAKSNKPGDMNAWWAMWKTVVDKYGSNENAYFEIFNEPNMYSKTDLTNLYNDWLTRYPTVPKGRVILDGTGDAQNVSDVGSDSRLNGCLLAVHEYSFFGSESMTSESQWVNAFKGEVGSYSDRTVCTEWGAPMSPGSKNGTNYDTLDYSKPPTNYFEAYLRGMSSQLKAWNMGSFYWPGLRDGDWYSMTIKTGSGANITLSIPNQSGLQQLQNSWTGPVPNPDAGAAGATGRDGGSSAGAGGAGGSSVGGTDGALASGGAGGAGANAGGNGGASSGTGAVDAAVGGAGGQAGAGGLIATGGATTPAGGAAGSPTTTSTSNGGHGGTSAASSGSAGSGGSASTGTGPANSGGGQSSGCSCSIGGRSDGPTTTGAFTLGLAAVVFRMVRRRRR
jgi:MYXO-CTERM domain-containing protein